LVFIYANLGTICERNLVFGVWCLVFGVYCLGFGVGTGIQPLELIKRIEPFERKG